MKKVLVILLLFLIPLNVFCKEDTFDTAKSSIVMDIDSGRVLYENNADKKQLIASTTKIMTCIIAIEEGNLDKMIKVEDEILKMYGTSIYLEVGEKMKLIDLLYGLMLRSGNDASVVIAKAVAGSEKEFVKLMNKKAKEIGMTNTTFKNPHGLDEVTKNYSTARDMAKLTRYAYKNKTYRKITSSEEYRVKTDNKSYLWYNRMKLLGNYKYCTGGKNGYTPRAGKTLVSTASKNGLNLTVVTLSDSNIYDNHIELYEDMFSKYRKYKIIDKNNFSVDKEFVDENIYLKESFYYPLTEQEVDDVKTIVHFFDDTITDEIGNIEIFLHDEKIGDLVIYSHKKKKEIFSFLNWLKKLFT